MKGVGDVLIHNGNGGSNSYMLFIALSNAIFKIALSYSNLMNASSSSIVNTHKFTVNKTKMNIHPFNCQPLTTISSFISCVAFPVCS